MYREVERRSAAGFTETTTKGSHVKVANVTPTGTLTATVPHHREVASGTLRSVLRQAGLTEAEFEKL